MVGSSEPLCCSWVVVCSSPFVHIHCYRPSLSPLYVLWSMVDGGGRLRSLVDGGGWSWIVMSRGNPGVSSS